MSEEVRILPGDLIAFSGRGLVSNLIKLFTFSRVSHVGVMLTSNLIIESTSLDGFKGVTMNPLSRRLEIYPGRVWLYPLAPGPRAKFDYPAFHGFLTSMEGRPYDFKQCLGMIWKPLTRLPRPFCLPFYNWEDLSKVFCSELAAAAYQKAGVLDPALDFSEISPADLAKSPIFSAPYRLK
jgi:hypothetical protein